MDKARDMRGDALAAGAETEAAVCACMESLVLEIFDLDDFGITTIQP